MKNFGFIVAAFLFFSCLNDRNTPLATATVDNPATPLIPEVPSIPAVNCSPDSVYFKQTILPLITSNCAMSGCHDAISRKEGVILTDYTNIMREVKVSSPASSDLYTCLFANNEERMPPAPAAEFSLTQKALILKWIQQGAKNNSCVESGNCISTNVSFNTTVLPILKTNCTGCHSGTSPSAGIDLNSYTTTKVHASNGKLVGSITHATGYIPMPSKSISLSSCEISQIKAWVSEGIKNN